MPLLRCMGCGGDYSNLGGHYRSCEAWKQLRANALTRYEAGQQPEVTLAMPATNSADAGSTSAPVANLDLPSSSQSTPMHTLADGQVLAVDGLDDIIMYDAENGNYEPGTCADSPAVPLDIYERDHAIASAGREQEERPAKRLKASIAPALQPRAPEKRAVKPSKRLQELLPTTDTLSPYDLSTSDHSRPADSEGATLQSSNASTQPTNLSQPSQPAKSTTFVTSTNSFGMYRVYPRKPENWDAQQIQAGEQEEVMAMTEDDGEDTEAIEAQPMGPYNNLTEQLWHDLFLNNNSSVVSQQFMDQVQDTIANPAFKIEENTVRIKTLNARLQAFTDPKLPPNFKQSQITIEVTHNGATQSYTNSNLLLSYRPLLESMIDDHENHPLRKSFNYVPFESWVRPEEPVVGTGETVSSQSSPKRVYDQIYTAKLWSQMDAAIQDLPKEHQDEGTADDCDLPRAVMAFSYYSDKTQLGVYGPASATPLQLTIQHAPKEITRKLSSNLSKPVCFIPDLDAEFQDWISIAFPGISKSAKKLITTLASRNLFHECHRQLFSGKFAEAFNHGTIVHCGDGVRRRLYPRLMFYAADYPEKCLIALTRVLGGSPCPRCLVKREKVAEATGSAPDIEQRKTCRRMDDKFLQKIQKALNLVKNGHAINSKAVESLLSTQSWVPAQSAFITVRTPMWDIFAALAPDILHELELGVFKDWFKHVLRIVEEEGQTDALNKRFRQMPKYGDSLRKFVPAVSNLAKFAARDYADVSKCLPTVIPGLLKSKKAESQILDVAYLFNEWRAQVKINTPTIDTMKDIQETCKELCDALRKFEAEICPLYSGYETEKERTRRIRASSKKKAKSTSIDIPQAGLASSTRKKVTYSLNTAKFHSLPDYPQYIELLGPVEIWGTERGERSHIVIKRDYQKGSKNTGYKKQLLIKDTLREKSQRLNQLAKLGRVQVPIEKSDDWPTEQPYSMAKESRNKLKIDKWLLSRKSDPVLKFFEKTLKDHLLSRLDSALEDVDERTFTENHRQRVSIKGNQLHLHTTLNINYTSYDLQRKKDIIHVGTDRVDCMVRSPNDDQPWYGRVYQIFHVLASLDRSKTYERVECCWIRWFERTEAQNRRYDQFYFREALNELEFANEDTMAFICPSSIIRAVAVAPEFHLGTVPTPTPSVLQRANYADYTRYLLLRAPDVDCYVRHHATFMPGLRQSEYIGMPANDQHIAMVTESVIKTQQSQENHQVEQHSVSNEEDVNVMYEDENGNNSEDESDSEEEFISDDEEYTELPCDGEK